jgi:hypothetical protein
MSDTIALVPTGDARLDELLANGTILPDQIYGNSDNPSLDVFKAKDYVGCDKKTIYQAEFRERLHPVPQRSRSKNKGGMYIGTYLLSELRPLREERQSYQSDYTYKAHDGVRITLKKVAQIVGISYSSLLQIFRKPKPNEKRVRRRARRVGRFDHLNIEPREQPSFRGRPSLTILDTEALRFKWAIDKELRKGQPKGFLLSSEIATNLQLKSVQEKNLLGACLQVWRECGLLDSKHVLLLRPGKITRKGIGEQPINKLVRWPMYDGKEVIKLWGTLNADAAAEKLLDLLKEGLRPVAEIRTEMRSAGFAIPIVQQGVRKAGAFRRHIGGKWYYDLLQRGKRQDAKPVLEKILKTGPLQKREVKRRLHEEGWSIHSPEIISARSDLEIRGRYGTSSNGMRRELWWCLPGQEPPTGPRPGLRPIIAFVERLLADGQPHDVKDAIAKADKRGISKSNLFKALPFCKVIREREPGKSGTWRAAQATSRRRTRTISIATLKLGGFCYNLLRKGVERKLICKAVERNFNGRILGLADATTYARRYAENPDDPKPWPPPRDL